MCMYIYIYIYIYKCVFTHAYLGIVLGGSAYLQSVSIPVFSVIRSPTCTLGSRHANDSYWMMKTYDNPSTEKGTKTKHT